MRTTLYFKAKSDKLAATYIRTASYAASGCGHDFQISLHTTERPRIYAAVMEGAGMRALKRVVDSLQYSSIPLYTISNPHTIWAEISGADIAGDNQPAGTLALMIFDLQGRCLMDEEGNCYVENAAGERLLMRNKGKLKGDKRPYCVMRDPVLHFPRPEMPALVGGAIATYAVTPGISARDRLKSISRGFWVFILMCIIMVAVVWGGTRETPMVDKGNDIWMPLAFIFATIAAFYLKPKHGNFSTPRARWTYAFTVLIAEFIISGYAFLALISVALRVADLFA